MQLPRLLEDQQMPEKKTVERAREDARQGKAPSTQAGEFVREEIHHVREGKHGARSPKQVIAIGLAKARRAGVRLPSPKRRSARVQSKGASRTGKRERHGAASPKALAAHARTSARTRSKRARSESAKRAAQTRRKRRH
jgi:hypothetical protein